LRDDCPLPTVDVMWLIYAYREAKLWSQYYVSKMQTFSHLIRVNLTLKYLWLPIINYVATCEQVLETDTRIPTLPSSWSAFQSLIPLLNYFPLLSVFKDLLSSLFLVKFIDINEILVVTNDQLCGNK